MGVSRDLPEALALTDFKLVNHNWRLSSGSPEPGKEDQEIFKYHALRVIRQWEQGKFEPGKWGFWIRPAFDGLMIQCGKEVKDNGYD